MPETKYDKILEAKNSETKEEANTVIVATEKNDISKPERKSRAVAKGKRQESKKKNGLIGTFISEDADQIGGYIFNDVLLPAIKKAVTDIVIDGIQMLLYGDVKRSRSDRDRRSGYSYVSYDRFYDRYDDDRRYRDRDRDRDRDRRRGYSPDTIVYDTRGEAEDVLEQMDAVIEKYGMVKVSDMCEFSAISSNYTDEKYGWTNINSAEVMRTATGDGWTIRMPRCKPLD